MWGQTATWVMGIVAGTRVWGCGHWGVGMGGTEGTGLSAMLQIQVPAPARRAAVPVGRAVLPTGACRALSSWTQLMRPH